MTSARITLLPRRTAASTSAPTAICTRSCCLDKSDTFTQNAQALCNFAEAVDVPVYLLAAPSGSQEQPEGLPVFAPNHSQREELQELKDLAGDSAVVVDTFDALAVCTVISISKRTITGTPSALTRRISRCAAPWAWRPLRLTITISAP